MAEKLQTCITRMTDAVTRRDFEQYIDWALSFHRSLVEMGGNGTFLKLWDSLHWDVRGRIALRRLPQRVRTSIRWWPCMPACCRHCAIAIRCAPSKS